MINSERRRSARVPVFHEEAAVIQSRGIELPVKIIDLSSSGALLTVVDMPALGRPDFSVHEQLELSTENAGTVFHVRSRVVRSGPLFIALEFIDEREGVQRKLNEKLNLIQIRTATAAGTGKSAIGLM
jgi:hypothetical protein